MRGLPRILVLSLILVLIPAVVLAGTVGGTATAGNEAPSFTGDGVVLASSTLTPQVATTLDITVTDPNTLADIDRIEITVFHDTAVGAGAPGAFESAAFDADQKAMFQWHSTGSAWTMVAGVATSWAVNTGSCVTPTLTGTSGTFTLGFTPGKLAKVAAGGDTDEWNVYVKVYDAADTVTGVANSAEKLNSMAAYIELVLDPGSVGFGTVPLGGTGTAISTPADHIVTTLVLTNAAYGLKANAGNWTGSGTTLTLDVDGDALAAASLSLCIDDAQFEATGYPATPQWLTTVATAIVDHGSALAAPVTAADAVEVSDAHDFYMGIKLSSTGIPALQYSGTITITATND